MAQAREKSLHACNGLWHVWRMQSGACNQARAIRRMIYFSGKVPSIHHRGIDTLLSSMHYGPGLKWKAGAVFGQHCFCDPLLPLKANDLTAPWTAGCVCECPGSDTRFTPDAVMALVPHPVLWLAIAPPVSTLRASSIPCDRCTQSSQLGPTCTMVLMTALAIIDRKGPRYQRV